MNLRLLSWRRWPLAVKLTVAMTAMIILVVATVTLLSIRREQRTFYHELERQADLLLAVMASASADALYTLDANALSNMLGAMGIDAFDADLQILSSGRIYDAEGRIIGDAYDLTATYGLNPDPFGQVLVESSETIYDWQPGQLIAGRSVMVGRQRLGAVSVGLSTAPLQAKIAAVRNQGILVGLAAIIVGVVFVQLLSRALITAPLQELLEVTRRIARGDLSQQIPLKAGDELALLGNTLEQMRAELLPLYQDLEQKVIARTQALQQSEERFREVVNSISHHVYMSEFAADGKRVNGYISPNVEALTGYPPEKLMADWSFWPNNLIHPDDRPAAARQADKFARGENSEMEYRLVRADGSIIWVHDSGRVVHNPERHMFTIYGVISDITRRKQSQEELAKARDEALEASRFKTQLLANVSHDLRTPLNAIIGHAELIQDRVYGPVTEKQDAALSKIIVNVGQLLNFVNNMLNQAQIEAGKITLKRSAFSPTALAADVELNLNVLAHAKGVTLSSNVTPDLPPIIYGDSYWLRQILSNLIGNAIKFTDRGRIRINMYQSYPNHWAMQVSDTGCGIPPEAQAYIFDAFRQVDGSLTRNKDGSGLGLSIVYHLVNLMGGELTLQSEVGQGSTFTVTLPLEPVFEEIT